MQAIARLTAVSALVLTLVGVAPAFATNTSEALKMCQANNMCHSRVGEHSVIMTVGKDMVECEKTAKGKCIVVHGAG